MATDSAPRLPRWVKMLAAIAASALIFGGVFGASTIVWMRKISLDAVNPAYIAGAIKSVGDFPDAALVDRHPLLAMRMQHVPGIGKDCSLVLFGEDKNKIQLNLIAFQSEVSDPDPNQWIDSCYDRPLIFPTITGRCQSIVDKGKVDINGHQFVYQIVALKDLNDMSAGRDPNTANIEFGGDRALAQDGGNGQNGGIGKDHAAAEPALQPSAPPTAQPAAAPAQSATAPARSTAPPAAYKGLIGCMTIGRKVVLVEAAAPRDHHLDVTAIADFLRQARSF